MESNGKGRGMRAPVLAVGDGALGFWAALRQVWPATREQRCWFHYPEPSVIQSSRATLDGERGQGLRITSHSLEWPERPGGPEPDRAPRREKKRVLLSARQIGDPRGGGSKPRVIQSTKPCLSTGELAALRIMKDSG